MPDKHKNDLNIEILVGLFMFIVLIALGVFTIVLSRQNFLQEKYPINVRFSNIGGLREGDNVFLRGMQVGVVKSTTLNGNHINVAADLEVPVEFHEGYKVEVVASSMLGGKILKIYEGPEMAPKISTSAVIEGDVPLEILDEMVVAVRRFRELTEGVSAGEGTLGKLIKDDSLYNYLEESMASFKNLGQQIENGEGSLGKFLSDDTMYDQLQSSLSSLQSVSQRLENGEGTLGRLLSKDETLYKELQTSLSNIQSITSKINEGHGTLGKLVDDDQLYTETQKLLEEVRAAIDDLRETSPVTTFGSVMFGAF